MSRIQMEQVVIESRPVRLYNSAENIFSRTHTTINSVAQRKRRYKHVFNAVASLPAHGLCLLGRPVRYSAQSRSHESLRCQRDYGNIFHGDQTRLEQIWGFQSVYMRFVPVD